MIRTHTFRGRRYRVVADEVVQGYVDRVGREVYVAAGLPPRRALDVAIHEAIHAEEPDLPEATVKRLGSGVARFLWRLGYRLSSPRLPRR